MDKKIANRIYGILEKEYPGVTTALEHGDSLQLLVATILSAQCTDKRVNNVTKELFRKYKSVKDFAEAKPAVLEKEIRSTGFYRNKTKNIITAAKKIISDYNSKVPDNMESLVKLAGVARKTANVVLFHAYGKNEGIAVDTHVKRLVGRIGFSKSDDPVKIEQDLMLLFNREKWGYISDLLISHGRKICNAKKPLCGDCVIKNLCLFYKNSF